MDETVTENTDIALETPSVGTFRPPSITSKELEHGTSYGYYSPLPDVLMRDMSTECVLGVDEAGRGPVLGEPASTVESWGYTIIMWRVLRHTIKAQWYTAFSTSQPQHITPF